MRRDYDVVINGVQTTLDLSDEQAAARGLKPSDARDYKPAAKKAAPAPANKARTAANK